MALIVVLQNISELAPVSDYTYQVLVGDGGPRSKHIESGMVLGHTRADGWDVLVGKLLSSRRPNRGEKA